MTSPRLIWTRRIAQLLVGLFLYGVGIAFMVRAEIGVAPWDVLTQGISKQTGLPFGLITNLVGVLVLLLWIPIRQKPGVGTVLNVLLIGPSAQLVLWLVPEQTELWVRIPCSSPACSSSASPPGSTSAHASAPVRATGS